MTADEATALTLLLKFLEQVEAGDAGAGEDDGVASSQVLTELLGHQTVELWLLQGVQTIWTRRFLQMDIDLQRRGRIRSSSFSRFTLNPNSKGSVVE